MEQSSDDARKLFAPATIDALEGEIRNGTLPDGSATLLFLMMVHFIFFPMMEPNYTPPPHWCDITDADEVDASVGPFVIVRTMWTGLYIMRLWRSYIRLSPGFTLKLNFVSLEFYNTCEGMVHGATNWFLICWIHRGELPWWRCVLRLVCDTRPQEGIFSLTRVGKFNLTNSVNATFNVSGRCRRRLRQQQADVSLLFLQGFLRTLGKVVQSFRAKLKMKQVPGIRVSEPKSKAEAWAIRVADAEKWKAFSDETTTMNFDDFKARLAREKGIGLIRAQALVEKLAPEMAAFMKDTDAWNKPLVLPEWRGSLKEVVRAAMVHGESPRPLEGKVPVHPSLFVIDETQRKKAEEHAAEWKADLKRHGVDPYESGYSSVPALLPICPEIDATLR